MTVKEFFASKTFRCIIVLLCIALISGGLLAVCNDLLSVSDEERVQRTIQGIYGKSIGYTTVYDEMTDTDVRYAFAQNDVELGVINNIYKLDDGNFLVKATGSQGYKQGTVSVWAVVYFAEGKFEGLGSVSIAAYTKQTLMSKWNKNVLDGSQGTEPCEDTVSGATYSSKAINNALNTILHYVDTMAEVQS